MAKNEKYSSQIYRVDCKNGFFEVLNTMFQAPYNKVHFNFITYDGQTKKQTKKLSIFMGLDKTLLLCNDILSGKLNAVVARAKQENNFNGVPINDYTSYFTEMGGTPESAVQRKFEQYQREHPWLQPGMAISRQFKIQAGQKMPWIFRAEYGPGRSNETGLIAPTGKAEEYVNIPMSNEDLKMFALMMQMHIQAYLNQFYAKLSPMIYQNEKIKVFTATPNANPNPMPNMSNAQPPMPNFDPTQGFNGNGFEGGYGDMGGGMFPPYGV